jgi:3-isopropylmalate dehydrogenase
MLLRWSLGLEAAAASVEAAVASAIDDGYRTADLVPTDGDRDGITVVGTRAMTAAIVERLGARVAAAS